MISPKYELVTDSRNVFHDWFGDPVTQGTRSIKIMEDEAKLVSTERKGRWMQTYSGGKYWPADPRPDDIKIRDIAHALSLICRYTGHVDYFYSVAEHSVLISRALPRELALQGLLHDATEAYLGDMSRPLKYSLPDYKAIEELNWLAISEKFGLPKELHPLVKDYDIRICLDEREALGMDRGNLDWAITGKPLRVYLNRWLPAEAERQFLARYRDLTE
jgi:hypothetical protein